MKSKLFEKVLGYSFALMVTNGFAQIVPTASFSINSATICAESLLQITDQSSNAPTAWSYSVNGVSTATVQNPDITFYTAGTYTIDFETGNTAGISAIYSETVLVLPVPVINISGSTLVCTGIGSTLSAAGADTYTWSSGSSMSMITVTPLSNSNYSLIGTSTLTGCSDSSFVFITTAALPTLSVSDGTICAGEQFTIVPSGASTYTYPGGSTNVTPTISTIYMVSGTDALTGCSDSIAFSVFVNTISITASNGSICAGQSFTILPSGASSYTYSSGSNVVSPSGNTTYIVSGTDATTGCTGSVTVSVNITSSPTIALNTGSVCAGSVFTIVPSGASNYTFSGGSNTVSPTISTSYTVSGTSPQGGCIGQAVLFLAVSPLPTVTVYSGSICAGDAFILQPTGALSYTFVSGTSIIAGVSSTVTPSVTTSYSITGTGSVGCVSSVAVIANVIVTGIKPTVTITSASPLVICKGESVILKAIGATNYTWSNGATTPIIVISPTLTSIFYVVGVDALSGCSGGGSLLRHVSECTGIEVFSEAIQFNLYPNPTTGHFTIEVLQNTKVRVMNSLGKIILDEQIMEGKNKISLEEQPAGIYFVNLKQNNESKTIRIIKN